MLRERLDAQGLTGDGFRSPEEVVGRLLAVQAQDGRGMRLAIRSRSQGLVATDVDRALTEDRSLVVSWLNRGTLHLVGREDFPWLHALTVPRLATSNKTRLKQEGVSPNQAERGADLIVEALREGPKGREELRELLESAGVPTAGQGMVHILLFTTIRDTILRGPVVDGDHKFALAEQWLGGLPEFDRDEALAELARRYLAGHGPASDRDLAKWAGVPLGQARRGLKAIAGELIEEKSGSEILVDLEGRAEPEGDPPTRLLGAFDPILHGWESREWLIPDDEARQVVTTNGIFRPTILAGGRIVGTWTMPGGEIELTPFGGLDRRVEKALEAEADRVRDYLAA